MDGAIIVNEALHEARVRERPADARPDDRVERDRHAAPHGRARREADRRARDLDLAAARDGDGLPRRRSATSSIRSRACSRRRTRRSRRSRPTAQRLEQVLTRLTALEFQNAVVLDDVLVVLQRAEMTTRMAEEIERDCVELGSEGRLIRLQLEELFGEVPREKAAVVRDYHVAGARATARRALEALAALLVPGAARASRSSPRCSATRARQPARPRVAPRGYRVALAHPAAAGRRDRPRRRAASRASRRSCAPRTASSRRSRASAPSRAREIREGLRRLQEHNLVDRYLQL